MFDIEIRGTPQLDALARRLDAAGDSLRRELTRAIRDAVEPLPAEARRSALGTLPTRGGLGARVASSPMPITVRVQGTTVHASFSVDSRYNVAGMDRGEVHHPVFGNRGAWVAQHIDPGWFTRATARTEVETRANIERAVHRVAARVTGGRT